jgi:dUTPase
MVYLISKDSKGKIRVVELDLINNKNNYIISRTTSQQATLELTDKLSSTERGEGGFGHIGIK